MRRHFDFGSLKFDEVTAHGGSHPIQFSRVVTADAGRGYNFLDMSILPPKGEIGIHTHGLDNEELYIIISGRGLMHLDSDEFEVEAGHVIVNRPGGTHGLRNIGDTDLRLVVIEVPGK